MRILSVVNQKGGCGKTTTTVNLSASLATLGKNVLVVDMDPQGHATVGLNATLLAPRGDLRSALLNVYDEGVDPSPLRVCLGERLDMVPSVLSLVALEQELSSAPNRERRLRDLLERESGPYDYVLIDSPPNLGLLTVNALAAGREVLIPVDTGMFSLHGLRRLFHVMDLIRERTGLELKAHILLTFFDRRLRLAKTILQELEEHFSQSLLQTKVRSNAHLKEAASYGLPLIRHRPSSRGAWDYMELAEEIVSQEAAMALHGQGPGASVSAAAGQEPDPHPETPQAPACEVTFRMAAPDARKVFLAGEFNDWRLEPLTSLEGERDGVWVRRVSLAPGNYQYKYFIDGQWVVDPDNPLRIVNEQGNVNSLLKVKPGSEQKRQDGRS
jgi:chromosome partitioning protein